ncbi:MAG: alpha/beta hydrolase, partial [Planctomycetota bacterium]
MSAIVCLPGLGADEGLFSPQLDAFDNAIVPAWPDTSGVRTVEGLADAHLTRLLDDGHWTEGLTLVGFSFGGQVALSMTHLAIRRGSPLPSRLVLLSAPRTRAQITRAFRAQVVVSRLIPAHVIAWAARTLVAPGFARACALDEPQTEDLRAMARRLEAPLFKRLARIAPRWGFDDQQSRAILDAGIDVRHLHSLRDPVIPPPPRETAGVEFLPERAHLLT